MTSNGKQWVRNITELAQRIGKNPKTVYWYKKQGAPVKKTSNGYDLTALQQWIAENIRQKADSPHFVDEIPQKSKSGINYLELYNEERALKTKAERERTELKFQIESGQYVPLDEVKKRDIEKIAVIKTGLLTMPRRIAQEVVGLNANQIEVLLKRRFRDLLEKFAKM